MHARARARAHTHTHTYIQDAVVLVHPTCGPTQEDDIDGALRYKTYEVIV